MRFLTFERPSLEDAKIPKQLLASEMTGPANTHDLLHFQKNETLKHEHHQPGGSNKRNSDTNLKGQAKVKRKPKKRKGLDDDSLSSQTLSPDDLEYLPPSTGHGRARSTSQSSASDKATHVTPYRNNRASQSLLSVRPSTSPKPIIRQQYVTIKFTDPKPSSSRNASPNTWSNPNLVANVVS